MDLGPLKCFRSLFLFEPPRPLDQISSLIYYYYYYYCLFTEGGPGGVRIM
jgi:hypothetical protein